MRLRVCQAIKSGGDSGRLFPLAYIDEVAGDCSSRGQGRRHQSGAGLHNLAPAEVALQGRGRRAAWARRREESRGTHTRLDFPDTPPEFAGRFFGSGDTPTFVPLPAEVPASPEWSGARPARPGGPRGEMMSNDFDPPVVGLRPVVARALEEDFGIL